MEENEKLLDELNIYLKEQKYDPDIQEFIISTFKSLYHNYQSYIDVEPDIICCEDFVSRYITLIKNARLKFVRNINKSDDFLNNMNKVKGEQIKIGYKNDRDGYFIQTMIKPTYYCGLSGVTNRITREISILFDDVNKLQLPLLMNTLIHELTHLYQSGYNLPSNILNRDYFIKLLREGHAIKEARHVNPLMPSFYTIPFSYDDQNNMFVPYKDIKGNKTALIYKYLYFKLEMLLGPNFMDEWATNKNDTLLLKACELIDSKYGKGVFKTLYEGIQIIFLNLSCLPDDDLNKMIAGNNDLSNKDKGTCKFYKMIESTNYSACRIFLTNPNSLTEAIVSLEKLMTKCFTIDKQQSYQTDNYFSKKFQYYILNMGDKVFNYKIMGNIEKKINCLKIYADFMSNNKELDIDDSIKFK